MKKFISILMVVIMVLTAVPLSGFVGIDLPAFDFGIKASAISSSGSCGANVTYTYNSSTGELVISGTGPMTNYIYDDSPFYESNIKSVVIESGVTTIGNYAFKGCTSLTSISIPDSVTTIGDCAFYYCKSLISITIPDSVTTISNGAFASCDSLTSVTTGDSVTTIGNYAFNNCKSLTSVTIPDSVTTIGNYAFCFCRSLTSVTMGDSVTTIGDYAFGECYSLTSVTMGDSVTTIGDYAFRSCDSLTSVTIGGSVTTIGNYAFYWCDSLTSVTIPDSVTTIGDYAFSWCDSLTRITVDADNTEYSSDSRGVLFDKNKTVLIQYPAGNTNSSYIIPDSVTTIGGYAFYSCTSLTSVTMGDSVTTIGDYAFEGCFSLTSVTIPDSITTIGDCAFYICYRLTSVYYKGFKEQWDNIEIGTYNGDLLDADIQYHYGKHTYNSVVTAPTCEEQGYTTYTCGECGYSYKADYVNANGHSFTNYISDGKATCSVDGSLTAKCDYCDVTDTKSEKGAHKFSNSFTIDIEPTCTSFGSKSRHCLNCTEKTNVTRINKLPHSYTVSSIQPTCLQNGLAFYSCPCGDSYTETIPAKGHSFDGSACTNCGYDKADSCSCNCHKSGISAIIWKIINFFNKLLRKNNVCTCGAVHY